MKFFLDSANVEEIKDLAETGLIAGVTTNPSLVAAQGKDFKKTLEEICRIVEGPVSAEVTAHEPKPMIKQGKELSKIAENIVIKVPLTIEGLKACHALVFDHGIMVNVTLCFSVSQALLAAQAGATFVSPFIGRLDDIGEDGCALIEQISQVYRQGCDIETSILAASIRNPLHMVKAALAGADYATVPPKVFRTFYDHPLTTKGVEQFTKDWEQSGLKI